MSLIDHLSEYFKNPQSLERLGICTTCPQFDLEQLKCNDCGCLMRLKVLIPNAKCPQDKW